MSLENPVLTVAVLDDNDDDREMTIMAVEAAGFLPFVMSAPNSLEEAVREIKSRAQALVSDHNLEWGEGADFNGAQIVSRCYQEGIPAVLVTGYMIESNFSIREFRHQVPELVSRSDLDGDRLRSAIESAQAELSDRPARSRIPRLALVRVDRVKEDAKQLDVVVPQWNPREKVSIPASILDVPLPAKLGDLVDRRFFAQVNTGAEKASELFFTNFKEAAAVPDDKDLQ